METLGKLFGILSKKLLKRYFLKKIVSKYSVEIHGVENLQNFKNKKCILASNHIQPKDKGLLNLGIAYDSFILTRTILNVTGQEISLVINYGLGLPLIGRFLEPFTKGFVKSFNFVPVNVLNKNANKNFINNSKLVLSEKHPILIYPFEKYFYDFNPEQKIKAGMALLALEFHVPIIPIYIYGCYFGNKLNQKIHIFFGEPIYPKKSTVDKIKEIYRQRMVELKKKREGL